MISTKIMRKEGEKIYLFLFRWDGWQATFARVGWKRLLLEEETADLHGSEIRVTQNVPAFAAYAVIAGDDPAIDDPFHNLVPGRPGDTCLVCHHPHPCC